MKYLILPALLLTPSFRLEAACIEGHPHYADVLIRADGASGTNFGDPKRAINGVRGAGLYAGSTDVFSLDKATDGSITIAWSQGLVCDGPGVDFTVFENAFRNRTSGALFFEPIVVSVSLDGINFVDFPHEYRGDLTLPQVYDDKNWVGFAGMNPVLYNEESNNFDIQGLDPLDTLAAGGDGFDISTLPDTELGLAIKAEGFRYIRLTGAPALGFPTTPISYGGYADLDGVYAKRFITP